MASAILLLCIILLPIVVILLFKINASLVFLSICLGNLLTQFVASTANPLKRFFTSSPVINELHPNDNCKLLLLLVPVIITMLAMLHSVKGNVLKIFNGIMALGAGLVGSLLVVPLLPTATAQSIVNSALWVQIANHQATIVSLSAALCLIGLWLQKAKKPSGKHGKHTS